MWNVTPDGGSGATGADPEQLWRNPGQPRRGRKPAFSREAITAAAVALADAEGLEAVTMRRVAAQQVGAAVMSLYSCAPDKETLLELMVDHVSGELPASCALTGDWRADRKAVAHDQRDLMFRHPWLPAALSARRSLGPNTLAFLERALAALRPTGLDGAAKLEVFAQLTAFVAGLVAHEILRRAATRSPTGSRPKPATSRRSPRTAATRNSPRHSRLPPAPSPPTPRSPGSSTA
ncbi:hypothetical protein GCM10010384_31290 [Streptomyces djakartensis]|uniref:Tetracycline repressor TetR C-terminal domain-containing protein n=1 Tax=Streptomyces djakartensis TaxID=68193 RepID=A0ABQ2ZQ27_9ACTN|nr:hypothetical protein GCM10010384_31290 [Streptomyces djakartensis]